jgi:hypothetical protein
LNAVTSKDLIKEESETYTMDEKTFVACGCLFMATVEVNFIGKILT